MKDSSTTCPCPACDDRRTLHIQRKTHTLAPHKPRRSMTGRSRRSILTACECAHTLAEKYGQTVYLHPTMYGWAINAYPSDFTSYVAVTPTGDCTEYVYDPCGVLYRMGYSSDTEG